LASHSCSLHERFVIVGGTVSTAQFSANGKVLGSIYWGAYTSIQKKVMIISLMLKYRLYQFL
jgi:hypothetical protein